MSSILGVGGNILKDTPYSFRVYKFIKRGYTKTIDIKTPFIPSGGYTNESLVFNMTLFNENTNSLAIAHVSFGNYTAAHQGSMISLIGDSSPWSVTKYDSDGRTHLAITYSSANWISVEILYAYLSGSNAQNLQTMYSENFV